MRLVTGSHATQASADTAIRLYDYTVPRTIVTEYWYTNDNVEQDVTTVCWRQWVGRDLRSISCNQDTRSPIVEVDAPG